MKRKIIRLAKEQKKAEKQQLLNTRRYVKLLTNAGAKLTDSPQTIDNKIINYISDIKSNFHKVQLSKAHTNDANFMEKLYNTKPVMTIYYPVSPENIEHQKNVNLMLAYLDGKIKSGPYPNYNDEDIQDILENYYEAAVNPEFIEKLIRTYSSNNILKISSNIVDLNTMFSTKEAAEKGQADFNRCIKSLPTRLLIQQISIFGSDILTFIPKDHPFYNDLKCLVETDTSKDSSKDRTTIPTQNTFTTSTTKYEESIIEVTPRTQSSFTKCKASTNEEDEPEM